VDTHAGAVIPSPDTSLGDSFAWPFRDPEWFNKIVLMGLIALIPMVGWLQLLGWMLSALDNLRHGWQVLPPAAFRYATRGINLFVASLIWGLAALVLLYGSMGVAIFALLSLTPKSGDSSSSAVFPFLFLPLMFGITAAFGLIIIALYVFIPPLILFTDRTGLGGAFNVAGFVHAIRTSPRESVAAAALALVSYFISGLGSYLCYIGILFAIPYSLALLAGVLRWYEVNAKPGALP
jgi:MFS family permease